MPGGEHLSNWAFFVHFIFNTMSGGEVGHDWRGPWTLDQGLFPRRTNLQVKYHYPIFRWNMITPESCENLVRLPRQHAEIHKHGSWENLTNENQEEIMHWINLFHFDLNTFTCCILLSGHLASTSPMKPWCGSTRSLWSRDSALPLSIQRGKYLAFALGWSSKSKQKIHAIRSYIIIENDNNDMHTKWWFKTLV